MVGASTIGVEDVRPSRDVQSLLIPESPGFSRGEYVKAKIGDGHFNRWGINSYVAYSSILKDYMIYKKKILDKDKYPSNKVILKDNSAGYNYRNCQLL